MDALKTCKFSKPHSVHISAHLNAWTYRVNFWKNKTKQNKRQKQNKKQRKKETNKHFFSKYPFCVWMWGQGGGDGGMWGWVCGYEVWMEVIECGDRRVGVGRMFVWGVFGGGDGWMIRVYDKWHVYMLILTINMSTVCLTQFGQKVDWVSFGNHCSIISNTTNR